jgi:hypothetical protein
VRTKYVRRRIADCRIVACGFDGPITPTCVLEMVKCDAMKVMPAYANTGSLYEMFQIR